MKPVVETLIEQNLAAIDGQLSDKSRVTDQLLDIRLLSVGQSAVVAEVDLLLANLPGLTTVENTWWRGALEQLNRTACAVASA